jgi:hypothetical protein
MNVVWHKSAEEVFRAYWGDAIDDDGVTLCALTGDGDPVESSMDEALYAIRQQGVWGFADTEGEVIHAWADGSADPALVIHMLAHEIGHLTGTPNCDDLAEELRADEYGDVAAQAYRMLMGRPTE